MSFDPDFSFVDHCRSIKIDPYKGFYKLSEISAIFGLSILSLRDWTKGNGKPFLPLHKVGSIWKVRRNDVVAYFNSTNEQTNIIPFEINRKHNLSNKSFGNKANI